MLLQARLKSGTAMAGPAVPPTTALHLQARPSRPTSKMYGARLGGRCDILVLVWRKSIHFWKGISNIDMAWRHGVKPLNYHHACCNN